MERFTNKKYDWRFVRRSSFLDQSTLNMKKPDNRSPETEDCIHRLVNSFNLISYIPAVPNLGYVRNLKGLVKYKSYVILNDFYF